SAIASAIISCMISLSGFSVVSSFSTSFDRMAKYASLVSSDMAPIRSSMAFTKRLWVAAICRSSSVWGARGLIVGLLSRGVPGVQRMTGAWYGAGVVRPDVEPLFLHVPREEIAYVKFVFQSYEDVAVARTLARDPAR